ncbi:hypothetical protein F4808DRAFT_436686 [Astrocystis sublimbata]|nr:hypothetical protein F4808DRAFT_436686 [Astrocystis sublimbata]
MYTKIVLSMTALAALSAAQTTVSPLEDTCSSSRLALVTSRLGMVESETPEASEIASLFNDAFGGDGAVPDTLGHPVEYQSRICSLANAIPTSLLPAFASFAADTRSFGAAHINDYDAYISTCVTTGDAEATRSIVHEQVFGNVECPQPTTTAGMNGTTPAPTASPYPTATGMGNSTMPTTSMIPIAGAARPTGVVAGAVVLGGLIGVVALL